MLKQELAITPTAQSKVRNIGPSCHSSFTVVVLETIKKELTLHFRYKANMVGQAFGVLMQVVIFAAMAGAVTLVGVNSLEGNDVFLFFLGSLVLIVFSTVALSAPLNAVIHDLHNGTLEYIFSTPISRYGYFVGTAISEAISKSIFFIPMFIVLLVYSGVNLVYGLMILAVCAAVIVGLVAFGVVIALMGVMWKQITAISTLLFTLFEFICGAYFPVSSMPIPLQILAYLLPLTWGYDLIRFYSFEGSWITILPIEFEWILLVVHGILYILLSYRLIRIVERRSKVQGLHLI
jgi:ABC-2 type transport system permease protein